MSPPMFLNVDFAIGISIGQRLYRLTREAVMPMLQLAHSLFEQGQSVEQVLEVMMPA